MNFRNSSISLLPLGQSPRARPFLSTQQNSGAGARTSCDALKKDLPRLFKFAFSRSLLLTPSSPLLQSLPHPFTSPALGLRNPTMTAPITSEVPQFSRTTFLDPEICRPRQCVAPSHLNLRPWRNEDSQAPIKVPSLDPVVFESDSFSGRSYSSSFLRSSAGHYSSPQCLPPPLTESPSPRPYLGFDSMPSYPEQSQYYLAPTHPQTSSGSPTFPLRPSEDWSFTRTSSLSSSQDSFWAPNHSSLAGLPELSHRRSYSTISSDAVSTPTRETDFQISPVSSESPWDRQPVEDPSPHDSPPTPRTPIAPWINESDDSASRARQPVYTARMRTSQACQKCRSRKAKVCNISD